MYPCSTCVAVAILTLALPSGDLAFRVHPLAQNSATERAVPGVLHVESNETSTVAGKEEHTQSLLEKLEHEVGKALHETVDFGDKAKAILSHLQPAAAQDSAATPPIPGAAPAASEAQDSAASPPIPGAAPAGSEAPAPADKHIVRIIVETIGTILLVLLLIILAFITLVPCWLGPAIKGIIESMDQQILGVEVKVGSISVRPCAGIVQIHDLKVENPKNPKRYIEEHMLLMETLNIKLNVRRLVRTALQAKATGKPVVVCIENFAFKDCKAVVEKHSAFTSNMKEVLDGIIERANAKKEEAKKHKDEAEQPRPSGGASGSAAPHLPGAHSGAAQQQQEKDKKPKPKIILKRVRVEGINVRFQIEGTILGMGPERKTGADLAVADIVDDNFSEHVGEKVADDIAQEVLKTLLKSIVTTIAGHKFGDHMF